MKYAFWNNKGGTGKTSLIFQAIVSYAKQHPDLQILVMDLCPQANLSELMLGGLTGRGSDNLLKIQGQTPRATVGGYFEKRLPNPYSMPNFSRDDFLVSPTKFNCHIPGNIDLLAGDALLELQATATSTLANNQIPGQDSWLSVIDWLHDFIEPLSQKYETAFIDCNPSFSIYTQIAISIADRLVLPVMADDSSRRALQNAFSLVFGLRLPSEIYVQHAFSSRIQKAERQLPKVHMVVKNRLTQYMGPASAYQAVLQTIDDQLEDLLSSSPDIFTFSNVSDGLYNVRDFGTIGVVSFARGLAFSDLVAGRHNISGRRVQVQDAYVQNALEAIDGLAAKL